MLTHFNYCQFHLLYHRKPLEIKCDFMNQRIFSGTGNPPDPMEYKYTKIGSSLFTGYKIG